MNGKRFLAVVMSLCMLSAEASHCAPFITQRIAAHADSAETGSNSSGKVKSLTTRIGDVNGDGKVTEDDKTLLQKWLVQMVSDNELKLINADVNRDGNVDIMDLVDLSRLISHDPDYVYGSSDEEMEELVETTISADAEVLSEINTDDNAFQVSLDIKASDDVMSSFTAEESEYTSAIDSDMVVGSVPSFECEDGAEIKNVELNFDVEDKYTVNTNYKYSAVSKDFEGIKRFSVFKYHEDSGMLLPVETSYDEPNNRVTAHVDDLGTYCLVDLEKWFNALGIKPEEFANISNTETNDNNTDGTTGPKTTAKAGDPIKASDFLPLNKSQVNSYLKAKYGDNYEDNNIISDKTIDIAVDLTVGDENSPEMTDLVKLEAKSFLYFVYNYHFVGSNVRVIFHNYYADRKADRPGNGGNYSYYGEAYTYEDCVRIIDQINVRKSVTGKYPETISEYTKFSQKNGLIGNDRKGLGLRYKGYYSPYSISPKDWLNDWFEFVEYPNGSYEGIIRDSFRYVDGVFCRTYNTIGVYIFTDKENRFRNYDNRKTDKTMAVTFAPYMSSFASPPYNLEENDLWSYYTSMISYSIYSHKDYMYFGYERSKKLSEFIGKCPINVDTNNNNNNGGSSGSGSGSGSGNTSGDNKVYDIITPMGWKKIKLKEPITRKYVENLEDFNWNFQDREGLNYPDSDYDGLFDFEEICFDELCKDKYGNGNGVQIRWDKDDKPILPTLEECMNGSTYMDGTPIKIKGMTIKEISDKSNCRILPIYSDPNDKDTDDDGINDFDEDREDRLKVNFVTIDDSLIDDSKCINGEKPEITEDDRLNIQRYGGYYGISEVYKADDIDQSEIHYKNDAIYTRTRKYGIYDAKFTLNPTTSSYFAFTITKTQETLGEGYSTDDYKSTVEIKMNNNQIQPVEIRLNDDRTEITYLFALQQDKEYSIYVNNPTNNHVGTYTIRISEDNWVYAPNGGQADILEYSKLACDTSAAGAPLASSQYYLSNNMLFKVYSYLEGKEIQFTNEEQVEEIMHQLGYSREEYTITKLDVLAVVLSDGSLISGIVSFSSSAAAEGLIAFILKDKFGTTSVGLSVLYDVIYTPNINMMIKLTNYWEKQGLKDAMDSSLQSTNEFNMYRCSYANMITDFWYQWDTPGYIRRVDCSGNLYKITPYDFNDSAMICESLGWKKP